VELATLIAEHHGDPNPGGIDAVISSYGHASHVVFGSSDQAHATRMPVLVIQVRGDFAGRRHPPHTPPPTGSLLTALVDVRTEALLGVRIGSTALDLASLGPTDSLNTPR
jgi:hypothetical protein